MAHRTCSSFVSTAFARRLLVHGGCFVALACFAFANDAAPVADKIAGHLAAGEFGPAAALALAAPTASEQGALLNQIADAQQASGDTEAALATRQRVPQTGDRVKARIQQNVLAGGSQANFGMLMNLIMRTIVGEHVKWEQQDGEGGSMVPFQNGIRVSPNGLLHRVSGKELAEELADAGIRAHQADLNEDVARNSKLRMVSLTRLERAVARRIEEGMPVPETMAQLAGLSQLKYVFVYPEVNEIVVAGPADGWRHNDQGLSVSVSDGRPKLQLDDLVTVLRTFARGEADFGCSINTRDEGVKELKQFVEKSQAEGPLQNTGAWVKQLQQKIGRQDVVVWGVPADSRVARVIVEADYRMKLIGIDKLDAGKEVPSYFDLLPITNQKNAPNLDALRWWLTMNAGGVSHSEDHSAFELMGTSVLCQSENQMLTAEGKHVPTGQAEATNRLFAQNFTNHYAKLAAKDLVFADTQNIFDLALCAALIKKEHLAEKAGWNLGVFAPDGAYATASYAVPKEIESVVNHRVYGGRNVVVQVAGGVTPNVMSIAQDSERNKTEPALENVGKSAKAPQLPVGRWWWDSAN